MTSSLIRRLFVFATLFALAAISAGVAADTAQGSAPQTVDFVAIAADGRPVPDLTPSQVVMKIDGKERALTSLEFVRFDTPASLLPAPFATNSAADAGRDFVLVVDEESIRPGAENPVREALLSFGATLPARDRIGLFTVPKGTTSLAPTTDRARFRTSVAAVQGRLSAVPGASSGSGSGGGVGGGQGSSAGCHSRDVLSAFASIVTATSRPGGPTPVVLFSVAIAGPTSGPASLGESEECRLTPREFQVLGQSADAARAQVFVVRPEEGAQAGRSEGLENVAGVTGGQMMALGRTVDDAMVRIALETSGYYVATFMAEAGERNGTSHRLELRSSRADVTVRSRSGVHIPRPDKAMTPQNMLRTAVVQTGFGLRAMAVASRNDGDAKNTVKLVGLAEPIDPSVKIAAAAAGVYDPTGKLVAQWTAKPEELQLTPIMAALVVPGGTYRFRVAAVDEQGRAATTDSEINTEMTSAGVAQLGGLLVGTAGTGFMPRLQFSTETEVIVYFELYGRPAGAFGALVEIAETTGGPAVSSAQPTPAATKVQDKFIFTAKLPVVSLKPGDYVVRASLAFEGQPTGVLLRTIRKK
jgi:VWFA-related protein